MTENPRYAERFLVSASSGFSNLAYRYYLESVGVDHALYRCAGQVEWPPEASSEIVRRLSAQRSDDITARDTRGYGN